MFSDSVFDPSESTWDQQDSKQEQQQQQRPHIQAQPLPFDQLTAVAHPTNEAYLMPTDHADELSLLSQHRVTRCCGCFCCASSSFCATISIFLTISIPSILTFVALRYDPIIATTIAVIPTAFFQISLLFQTTITRIHVRKNRDAHLLLTFYYVIVSALFLYQIYGGGVVSWLNLMPLFVTLFFIHSTSSIYCNRQL